MRGTAITEEEFGDLLSSFTRSAFRLETYGMYALDYEQADFDQFLAGSPVPPPEVSWWRPWLDRIADLTRQGVRVGRVRILAEPPTIYQQWELWAAPWHAAAGEEISYMPATRAAALGIPADCDWWLLDDERLILMRFGGDGQIEGKTLITDREIVARHRGWRDLAVRNATPAGQFAAA